MKTARLVFAATLCIPVLVLAHTGAQSFEAQTDEYRTDIGYDIPLQKGEETLMDVGLFTIKDGQPDGLASYTRVNLRIYSGSTVLFERSINKPEFGKAFVTVTPAQAGQWALTADFSMSGVIISSSSFEILIADALPVPDTPVSRAVIFGVLISLLTLTSIVILKRA